MANWGTQLRDLKLPFLIAARRGVGTPGSKPSESGWAALMNEQRLAVRRDPRAALASAIDLGEWVDIHPANKQEVGRRLALAGRSLTYPAGGGKLGPMPVAASHSGSAIIVTFT